MSLTDEIEMRIDRLFGGILLAGLTGKFAGDYLAIKFKAAFGPELGLLIGAVAFPFLWVVWQPVERQLQKRRG